MSYFLSSVSWKNFRDGKIRTRRLASIRITKYTMGSAATAIAIRIWSSVMSASCLRVVALVLSVGMAAATAAPALLRDERVGITELMPIRAMGPQLPSGSGSRAAEAKALSKDSPIRRKNLCERKAGTRAFNDGVCLQATAFSQVSSDVFTSINLNLSGDALIALLFASRRPSTVARFVVAVVIGKTVESHTGGAFSHVSDEVRERCDPPFADDNSTTTIVEPWLGIRVGTAINHAAPNRVQRVVNSRRSIVTPSMAHGGWDPSEIVSRKWLITPWSNQYLSARSFSDIGEKAFELEPLCANRRAITACPAEQVCPRTVKRVRVFGRHAAQSYLVGAFHA